LEEKWGRREKLGEIIQWEKMNEKQDVVKWQ
jgi:hypothetical protein